MNNTIKVIETKLQTPFGDLRKRSIYTATPIQVSGGIYFTGDNCTVLYGGHASL